MSRYRVRFCATLLIHGTRDAATNYQVIGLRCLCLQHWLSHPYSQILLHGVHEEGGACLLLPVMS